ncbi:hypothetical protein NOR51B_1097 [Luminiphilus syltensis NOR5-1B]|uniref:Uncharacterized protein n=1 Tax=Luminiphilus syltensis NOR5-1B TaxID=565045 RepID=B8KR22_9GAMM|nr:DUF1631 family protein [Luminiphilus syltensis]EED35152.1 hypothetical protein NOR51B_1097 [Luminiphilus syltensis NOR5-1B]
MSENIDTTVALDPRISGLRQTIESVLTPRMRLVLEEMTEHLFNLSSSGQLESDARAECFEAFAALKNGQKLIAESVLKLLLENFNHLVSNGTQTQPSPTDPVTSELGLVDRDSFEDELAIEKLVKLGLERFSLPLEALTLRIAEIVDEDPLDIRMPIDLRAFFDAYRTAIALIDLDRDAIAHLDGSFARNLFAELGNIYGETNQYLIDANILPELESRLEREGSILERRRQSKRSRERITPKLDAGPGTQAPGYESNNAHPGSSAGTLEEQARSIAANDAHDRRHERFQTTGFSSASRSPDLPMAPETLAKGTPTSRAYLPGYGAARLGSPVTPQVLNRLYTGGYSTGQSVAPDAARLRHRAGEVADNIAQLREQGVIASESDPAMIDMLNLTADNPEEQALRESIGLVDSLYETVANALPEQTALRRKLDLIKWPLAQLSASEPHFYENPEHPARLLIDRLGEMIALSPANNPRVEKRVESVLDTINRDFNGDLSVFTSALSDITDLALQLLRQQQRNIERHVAAEEGRERRQLANQQVEQRLLDKLPELQLPESLLKFIDEVWRDHLIFLLLRDTDPTTLDRQYALLRQTADGLLSITRGQECLDENQAQGLSRQLWESLDNTQFLTGHQQALLTDIQRELTGATPVALLDSTLGVKTIYREPDFSERLATKPRLKRWVRRARGIDVGTWLSEQSDQSYQRNVQLIWRNESLTRFAFANEQGHLVFELHLLQFARQLHRRLRPLRPDQNLSFIERSVFATLEKKQTSIAAELWPVAESRSLDREQLVDAVQTNLRRARRRGASHCALVLFADAPTKTGALIEALTNAGIAVEAEGLISRRASGVIVETPDTNVLHALVGETFSSGSPTGIGLVLISSDYQSAEEIWSTAEDTAARGYSDSPNTGLVVGKVPHGEDLQIAVRSTFESLKGDLTPTFSLRRIDRLETSDLESSEPMYQVLLDGMADASSELQALSGHRSVALSIALDCVKVSNACTLAERLAAEGREVPVFHLAISSDAALHHDFLDFVLDAMSRSGIGTNRLCYEFRDSMRLRQSIQLADFTNALRSIGSLISVCNVNPSRGSTGQLQVLCPHNIVLDPSLWPPAEDNPGSPALHQVISDLHHLVGEHVILRDPSDMSQIQDIGIDFVDRTVPDEISADTLVSTMAHVKR